MDEGRNECTDLWNPIPCAGSARRESGTATAGAAGEGDGLARQAGLVISNLVKDFAGLRAVDGVSLTVRPGEIVGVIGPNGSGKTTLVNVVTGLLKPTAGRTVVDGVDITAWPPHRIARQGISRTFQTVKLFRELTVLENVEVAAVGMGLGRRRARRRALGALADLGVEALAELPAGALPFGHERRVEIARALAMTPRYLLLDEPAAGLNELESDDLLRLLGALPARHGCGMLVIEHDLRLVMRLCGRLHVLNHGRTIGEGTPQEVCQDPQVVSAYLGSARGGGHAGA